jgi:hypothetical protein
MQKKSTYVFIGVFLALIFLAGACSTGFVLGRTVTGLGATSVTDLPFLVERAYPLSHTGRETPDQSPQDREKLFTPSGRPGTR